MADTQPTQGTQPPPETHKPLRERRESAKAAPVAKGPKLPVLAEIINTIIDLNPDWYFRKRYDDIQEAASELPLVIEYINESLQRAAIAAADAKRDTDSFEGETYSRIRQEWTTKYSEKMTEKALEMAIIQDKDLNEAMKNYSVLKSYVVRLSNMQENLRAKLDMLRSVEATRRKTISDEPND
jgi:hypothetical protein